MPTEVIMPKVDMDMETGTVATWHCNEGDRVEQGEALFDIETDKATMEVEAPASGTLQFIVAREKDEVAIGGNVAWIFAEDEEIAKPENVDEPQSTADEPQVADVDSPPMDSAQSVRDPDHEFRVRATPLARRLARRAGLQLSQISGSGPRGRVLRSDVEKAKQNGQASSKESHAALADDTAKRTADKLGIEYSEIPVDRMRAAIASRLSHSKSTVPHFYLDSEVRLDALISMRTELNNTLEKLGKGRISINDMLVRACALTLAAVPEANASWSGDTILRYADANISVAVAVDGGLITPVVRQAQQKGIQSISIEIADLAERARLGKLSQDEYQGGSFSISNLGMYGVKSFNAIINPPESMILAVGQAVRQFVPDENDNPIAATMMALTLSCDHRVVDGALGAKWLQHLKMLLENPLLLALEPTH